MSHVTRRLTGFLQKFGDTPAQGELWIEAVDKTTGQRIDIVRDPASFFVWFSPTVYRIPEDGHLRAEDGTLGLLLPDSKDPGLVPTEFYYRVTFALDHLTRVQYPVRTFVLDQDADISSVEDADPVEPPAGWTEDPTGSALYVIPSDYVEDPAGSGLYDIPTSLTEDPTGSALYPIGA